MIVLDTNVWSILSKPNADRHALQWMIRNGDDFWLSAIVIAEIQAGIDNPAAAHRRDELTQWLSDLEEKHRDRTLPFDSAAAHIFGKLIAQRKMEKQETKLLDLQIAAQALSRDCPVATRNLRDLDWTGVRLIDPWNATLPHS